jgi:hypothetical protein
MLMQMGRFCGWASKALHGYSSIPSTYVLLAVLDRLIILGLPLLSWLPGPMLRIRAALVVSQRFNFWSSVYLNLGLSTSPCNRLCNPKTYSGSQSCATEHVITELMLSFNPDVS